MALHFYWTYLETQKGPNYWYEQSFLVWCLLRQRNGGLNSGQKPTTIVTDAFKVICNDIHTSVYDERDYFGCSIVNFPWFSGDVPRLPSYGIYISQFDLLDVVFDFHSKNLQITSKQLTKGYRYHKLRKTFWKFFRSYSELLSKFGAISFQEYVSKGSLTRSSTVILSSN